MAGTITIKAPAPADDTPPLSDFGSRYLQQDEPNGEPGLSNFGKKYIDTLGAVPKTESPLVTKDPEWDALRNTLNAALAGLPVSMAAQKPKVDRGEGKTKGKSQLEAVREWEKENPGTAAVTNMIGSLAPIGAAGKLVQAAEAPLMATRLAKALQAAGETPGIIGKGAQAATQIARGAAEGAGQGALLSGLDERPLGEQVGTGAGIGAVVNPITKAIGGKLFPALTARQAHRAQEAKDIGVPLLPSQVRTLQDLSTQEKSAMKAAGESMGFPTHAWGQKAIAARQQQLYRVLDSASDGVTIPTTNANMNSTFNKIKQDALDNNLVTTNAKGKFEGGALGNVLNKLEKMMASGQITGDEYRAITQKNSELQSMMARTHPQRGYGIEINNMLNEALEDAAPQAAQAIRTARHQLHNSHILNGLYDESTGRIDFTKLLPAIAGRGGYGSAEMASKKASAAGYSGDIGKLGIVGQHLSPQQSHVLHDLAEGAKLPLQIGAGDVIARAAESGSVTPDISRMTAVGTALYAAKKGWDHVFDSPWYMNRLMKNAGGRKPAFGVNPLTGAAIEGYQTLDRAGQKE